VIRKARGLAQSLEAEANDFGEKNLEILETLMAAVYAAREGPPEVPLRRQQHAKVLREFLALCERHANAEHKKTRELAREFLNDWDTFLGRPRLSLAAADE
jgi:hypothetical protein